MLLKLILIKQTLVETILPGPPTGLQYKLLNESDVLIMWEDPHPNGADPSIVKFSLEVWENNQWIEHSSLVMFNCWIQWSLKKRMRICKWSTSAREKVRVVAFNGHGRGEPSEEIKIKI